MSEATDMLLGSPVQRSSDPKVRRTEIRFNRLAWCSCVFRRDSPRERNELRHPSVGASAEHAASRLAEMRGTAVGCQTLAWSSV